MKKLLLFFLLGSTHSFIFCQSMTAIDQTPNELPAINPQTTISILVKMSGTNKLADVTLLSDTPYKVRIDKSYVEKYRDAIKVVKNNTQSSMEVTADMVLLNKQGTYEITVQYKVKSGPIELFAFSLTRPAATIDTVSTVHIEIAWGNYYTGAFMLNADNSRSTIHNLKLGSPYFRELNHGALIKFSDTPYSIVPNQPFQAEYTLNKDATDKLSLGRYTGKMRIMTPEMQTPVVVNFDVWNRVPHIVLFAWIFVGLILGFLAKHFLKSKKEWESTRLRGFQLQIKAITETRNITDESFKKDINNLLSTLNPYLNTTLSLFQFGDPQKNLSDKIEEVQKKYDERTQTFNTYFDTQRDNLKTLSGALYNTELTDTIREYLAPVQNQYNSAKTYLDKFDPSNAEINLKQATDQIRNLLITYTAYFKEFGVLLNNDTFYPVAFPANIKVNIQKYAAAIEVSLQNLKSPATTALNDIIVTTVSNVNVTDDIIRTVNNCIIYINEVIPVVFVPEPGKAGSNDEKAFFKKIEDWKIILNKIRDNPEKQQYPGNYLPLNFITELNAAWKLIATATVNNADQQHALLTITNRDTESLDTKSDFIPPGFNKNPAIDSIIDLAKKAGRSEFWASLLQTVILLLLIGAGVYSMYADGFTGTWREVIAVVIFVFSLDITVDSVATLNKNR